MGRGFRKTLKRLLVREDGPATDLTSQVDAQSHDDPFVPTSEPLDETDMWMRADKALREDKSKREAVILYDRILEQQYGGKLAPVGTPRRREQMLSFTTSKLKELEDPTKRAKIGVSAGKAKDLFDAAVKGIVRSKEVISAAAQPCLPASVACAGFMLLLTTYVQAAEERAVFYEGVKSLSWSVYRLAEYERLLWNRHGQPPDQEVEYLFVESCSMILYFQAQAAQYMEGSSFKRGLKDAFRVNAWDTMITDVKEAEKQIRDCASRKDSQDILAIFSRVMDIQDADGQDQHADDFLQQLYSHAYPYTDRKNRNKEPVKGTCKWFANQDKFKNWESTQRHSQDDTSTLLYVTADPGCGKSVLARHLVDTVLPRDGRAVCYAFFKDDFEDQKTSLGAACAMLHQLLLQSRHLITNHKVLGAFRSHGTKFFDSFENVWETFAAAASEQDTLCVLDALDECRDADRSQLVAAISKTSIPNLRFLLTSRPYDYITRDIRQENDYEISSIHIQGDQGHTAEEIVQEILLVVEHRIDDTAKYWKLSADERQLLEENIRVVPNRTYLWVTLVFDGLMRKNGIRKTDIIALATELPEGIDAAYEKLLSKSRDPEQTRKLLEIILAAERPLSSAETAIALACDGQSSWSGLMNNVVPESRFRDYVRDLCGLFVSVVDDKVYLLHQTAREFLQSKSSFDQGHISSEPPHTNEPISTWQHSISLLDSNDTLAMLSICIVCLSLFEIENASQVQVFESLHDDRLEGSYFFCHWTTHYRQSSDRIRIAAAQLAEALCSPSEKRSNWLYFAGEHGYLEYHSLLVTASQFGLDKVVDKVLRERATDSGCTETGDTLDASGWTLLHRAALNGYLETVKVLLTIGKVNVDLTDKRGETPLYIAAFHGQTETVKVLLTIGKANVDLTNIWGRTPLFAAALHGHTETMKVLLTIGKANPTIYNDSKGPPLHFAAFNGHLEMFQLLPTIGKANVDLTDNDGWTPLHHAAQNHELGIVEMLVRVGKANANLADRNGQTPLHIAVLRRQIEIVEILLTEGKASADVADINGRTPLALVPKSGMMFKLLCRAMGEDTGE